MRVMLIAALSVLAGCSQPQAEPQKSESGREEDFDASDAALAVSAKALDDHQVKFEVETTLPLPVEVVASVSLKGQAPEDVYIGHSERMKIEDAQSTFIVDTSKAQQP